MPPHLARNLTIATLALTASPLAGVADPVGGLLPRDTAEGPVSLTPASPLKRVEFAPRQIDQGVQDRGALSGSLWDTGANVDLRAETGWWRIFETRARDGRKQYVRYDGAIAATFPNSDYVQTEKQGVLPVTPGGTQFHIGRGWQGDLTGDAAADAQEIPANHSPLYINGRISGLASEPVERRTPHVEREVEVQTVADEAYRQRRIGELMRLAALDLRGSGVSSR